MSPPLLDRFEFIVAGRYLRARRKEAVISIITAISVLGVAAGVIFFPLRAAGQANSEIPPDATPQIQQIDPSQAAPGAQVTVVIRGSNFSVGAYVLSVSAAIHIESSKRVSVTQVEAQLSVSSSAQPSTVSLLVANPASRAAEAGFKIVPGPAATNPTAPAAPAAEVKPSAPATPAVTPAPAAPAPPAAEVKPTLPAAPAAPA
ncbi:MAG: IPT/TIG domain-containing protein, partial [Bryobacteraceae bacterium]